MRNAEDWAGAVGRTASLSSPSADVRRVGQAEHTWPRFVTNLQVGNAKLRDGYRLSDGWIQTWTAASVLGRRAPGVVLVAANALRDVLP